MSKIPLCKVCRSVLTRNERERFQVYCLDCHVKNWGRRIRAMLAHNKEGGRDADETVERDGLQADVR